MSTRNTSSADETADLLAIYDCQLRAESEVVSAVSTQRHGPLLWATFVGGRGFVTYADLDGWAGRLPELVAATVAHYAGDPDCLRVEWKTRGHDDAPGLAEALGAAGFVAEETESVMLGRAADLAAEHPLPDGVSLRCIDPTAADLEAQVRAMADQQDAVFGDIEDDYVEALLHRLSLGRGDMELWVAEAGGEIICSGRLEPVAGTDVAGIWGGSTLPGWQGRGIYRALTAARARSAMDQGKTLIHSDSSPDSRPILERSGFVPVTTTTTFVWRRPAT